MSSSASVNPVTLTTPTAAKIHNQPAPENAGTEHLAAAKPTRQEAESSSRKERRPREGADDGADSVARGRLLANCDFNQAALHPAYPIKCRTSTQRTQAPESVDTRKSFSA